MTEPKYSVLIMRDDSPVRTMRVGRFWFRTFVYVQITLIALTLLGAFFGYNFWQQNFKQSVSNRQLRTDLADMRIKLERLQNVEEILKSNDPEELQALICSVNTNAEPLVVAPPIDLVNIMPHVDMRQAGLANIQARMAQGQLQVKFEVNNLLSDGPLTGLVQIALITRTGSVLYPSLDRQDLDFTIQRFKRIRTSLQLPPSVDVDQLYGVRISIEHPDGTVIFSDAFPLADILA